MTGGDNQDLEIDPLEREAAAWVRRLTSGQATAADAAALRRWRSQSEAHATAFFKASHLWRDIAPAANDLQFRDAASFPPAGSRRGQPAVSRRRILGGGLAAAAAAGAYCVVRPPFGLWSSLTELTADYRTATGEQQSVSLSADVSIRMNTQTSIAVRSSGDGTESVEVIAGEASFSKVARNGRSLAVLAAGGLLTADSASFDVRCRREDSSVCVSCFDGELNVAFGAERTTIGLRQRLQYDGGGLKATEVVDPEVASAWQRGVLVFKSTLLADVVKEVNRYRPGRIILVNPQIGRTAVSGRYRIDNLNEILLEFEQVFGAKVRSLPGGVVLLS